MLDITDDLLIDSDGNLKPMLLSADNFFNLFRLIDQCSLRSIPIIGTLRADRLKEVPISSEKRSSYFKREKGSEEEQRVF